MKSQPDEKKKILVITPDPPWTIGGVEKIIPETLKYLKDVFDITIYSSADSTVQLGEFLWKGIPVMVFKDNLPPYRLSLPLYKALKDKREISLIHAHNYSTFIPLLSRLACKDVPFIINSHFHESGSSTVNSILRKFYDLFIGPRTLLAADMVVCNSRSEESLISRKFRGLKRTCVIYNGAAIDELRNARPFDIKLKKVVLSVSRLVRYKHVHLILHALQHLPEEYEAVIIGKGPEIKNLIKLTSKLGLEKRVKMLGNLSDEEVHRWYRTAAVFMQLSGIESFGLTPIEALAAGTPVVANDDKGGLKETIDIFQPDILAVDVMKDSPRQIAQAIEKASYMQLSGDLATKLDKFKCEYISHEFAELYNQVIKTRKT